MSIRFRKGNKTVYYQDFRFFTGLPHGVDFDVKRVRLRAGHSFRLTAYGYGQFIRGTNGKAYGNGAIHVEPSGKHMRRSQATIRRLEAAAKG